MIPVVFTLLQLERINDCRGSLYYKATEVLETSVHVPW